MTEKQFLKLVCNTADSKDPITGKPKETLAICRKAVRCFIRNHLDIRNPELTDREVQRVADVFLLTAGQKIVADRIEKGNAQARAEAAAPKAAKPKAKPAAKKAKAGTELDLLRKAAANAGKKTAAAPKTKNDVFAKTRKEAVKTSKKK